jgi:hypothetical protein
MISYDTIEEAMAARQAERRARIDAATGLDHTPRPVDDTAARTLIAATGHAANGITISGADCDDALIAIGRHEPKAFMAAVHAITGADNDPFGLFDSLYGEVYNGVVEFAAMTGWGAEDVWHAHVIVIGHGHSNGDPGVPDAAGCQCIDHAWAMREVPEGSAGAIGVTVYQSCAGNQRQARYADLFGPDGSDR